MKLNYRDKVILGILLAIVILIGGFVGLVKPKSQDIETDSAELETKQTERDEVQGKLDQIEPLTKKIQDTYSETNTLAQDFVSMDEINYTYKLDQFLRDKADECEVKINTLSVGDMSTSGLEYYYFEHEVIGEDMLASADLNGDMQAGIDEEMAEETALSERTEEEVMSTEYGLTVTGTKENIWKYMETIKDFDDAVIINSVDISDYTFGEDDDENTDKTSQVSFVMTLYSVYDMAEPDTSADK